MGKSKQYIKRVTVWALALLVILGAMGVPGALHPAFAAENPQVKIEQTGGFFATQGDRNVPLLVRVTNNSNSKVSFSPATGLSQTSGALTEPNPNTGTVLLESGQSTDLVFSINVSDSAAAETHLITVTLMDKGDNAGQVLRSKTVSVQVGKKISSPVTGNPDSYLPAADMVHSLSPGDSIIAGANNTFTLAFTNRGNTAMRDTKVILTLPEGITVNNGSSTLSVGFVSIGDTKTVAFPLTADSSLVSKNYPITVRLVFSVVVKSGEESQLVEQTIEQTLYVPVSGSGGSAANVAITSISLPMQAASGDDFTLSFRVENRGSGDTGKLKIYTESQDGLPNKTQNVFLEQGIAKGESKVYTVTYFSEASAAEKNYPIRIVVEPASGGKEGESVSQYAGIFIKRIGSGSIKTPQLMVTSYTFGGSYVQAGDEFRLNLKLSNTSGSHDLQNIKITVDSTDGTFIPVQSSNSFYIDKIARKGSADHSMTLSVKPDAAQKTTSVNLNMSYEDMAGNAYTASDVISIPVMQETRLVVDDIIAPPELYTGMQTWLNIQFYNMGKTILSNLRIRAEGDFDTVESSTYYVGNMDSGRSDSYSFSFIPRAAGPMDGKVIFTYEDASGNEQSFEKEFNFQIMDMPMMPEEPFPPMEEPQGNVPWIPIGIGTAVFAAAAVFLIRRHRKKKIHKEMSIDE